MAEVLGYHFLVSQEELHFHNWSRTQSASTLPASSLGKFRIGAVRQLFEGGDKLLQGLVKALGSCFQLTGKVWPGSVPKSVLQRPRWSPGTSLFSDPVEVIGSPELQGRKPTLGSTLGVQL
jgi:hypothetical protein